MSGAEVFSLTLHPVLCPMVRIAFVPGVKWLLCEELTTHLCLVLRWRTVVCVSLYACTCVHKYVGVALPSLSFPRSYVVICKHRDNFTSVYHSALYNLSNRKSLINPLVLELNDQFILQMTYNLNGHHDFVCS
jgi:hypothetical protein